ncbi:MAG: SIS domain-containing protein [Gemmatimonadota bacterium]
MRTAFARAELAAHAEVVRLVSQEMAPEIAVLAELVVGTLRSGGKLLFCGNGGSAADAQHLAAEYVIRFAGDRPGLPAIALTADGSVLTAGANDFGFERVFERQVRSLGRPGDLLCMHSTSGASTNLLAAADAARDVGMKSAALLAMGGGPLRARVDLALVVPTESVARAQELHITIGHIVCALVEEAGLP